MKKTELKSIFPIHINPKIGKFIQEVNYLINKNLLSNKQYSEKKFVKNLFKCQQEIN